MERWVAGAIGGRRRGAHVGDGSSGSGKSDVILDGFSIEVKLLKAPSIANYYSALKQAMDAREDKAEIPVAFVAKGGSPYGNAMGVMRLSDFEVTRFNRNGADPIVLMLAEDLCALLRSDDG
jgi:hypothetical protein